MIVKNIHKYVYTKRMSHHVIQCIHLVWTLVTVAIVQNYLPTSATVFVQCNTKTEHGPGFTFMLYVVSCIQIECICRWYDKTND